MSVQNLEPEKLSSAGIYHEGFAKARGIDDHPMRFGLVGHKANLCAHSSVTLKSCLAKRFTICRRIAIVVFGIVSLPFAGHMPLFALMTTSLGSLHRVTLITLAAEKEYLPTTEAQLEAPTNPFCPVPWSHFEDQHSCITRC